MQKTINLSYKQTSIYIYSIALFLINISCNQKLPHFTEINQNVVLNPDYTSISIPPNIAPLNFNIDETSDQYMVRFHNSNGIDFIIRSKDGNIDIPQKKWTKLLQTTVPGKFFMDVFVQRSQQWVKYNTITNNVTSDSIDNYLAYRLIEPGFETYNKMGIYQRNLENFEETPIMLNSLSDGNCMNCHTFCKNNSNTMMFHMRGKHGGTIIYRNQNLTKINTKTKNTISPGVYSSWHPSGNYIAYSTNNTVQSFHATPGKKIEVYDTLSDIIVYNTKKNIVTTCEALSDPNRLETFPTWSPDGLYLYFCCAKKQPADIFYQTRYDLFRIAFDPESCSFGLVDTIYVASYQGKTISFPRISPDGRYLLFCMFNYGNFSIWHPESDLYLLDLTNRKISKPEINSSNTESFHTWSSTGRWIVFSSRREDGLYTRPYFSYFDSSGKAHKPFILPQRKPGFYFNFLKSYNLPELVTSRVELNPRKLMKITASEPVNATFKSAD
ncbi:MAG: hypothetical protein LLG13_02680 [Bacteroidales bacterium]|nr:hypothetical protein [Bacteroidales bacterium]